MQSMGTIQRFYLHRPNDIIYKNDSGKQKFRKFTLFNFSKIFRYTFPFDWRAKMYRLPADF